MSEKGERTDTERLDWLSKFDVQAWNVIAPGVKSRVVVTAMYPDRLRHAIDVAMAKESA